MLDNSEDLYGGHRIEDFPENDASPAIRLVANKTPESPILSYKSAGFLNKGHTEQLCPEFCSFFNSGGGVIIVGVEEEGDQRSEDYKLPAQIAGTTEQLSHQWLQDVLVNGILPPAPLDKIRISKFPAPNDNGQSGHVIFVPKSYAAPHQVVSDGKYYKRGIEGRVFLLHWEVMDMLGRGQRPQVTIEPYDHTILTKGAPPNTDLHGHLEAFTQNDTSVGGMARIAVMTLWFTVGNCGKAPARNISVRIHGVGQPLPGFPREGARWRHVPAGPRGEWYCAWEPDFPLLPKAAERFSISYETNVPETERDANSQMPLPFAYRQINIVGEVYAEGQDPMSFGLYLRAQFHMGEYNVADDDTLARGIIPPGQLSGLQTDVIKRWDLFDEAPPDAEAERE